MTREATCCANLAGLERVAERLPRARIRRAARVASRSCPRYPRRQRPREPARQTSPSASRSASRSSPGAMAPSAWLVDREGVLFAPTRRASRRARDWRCARSDRQDGRLTEQPVGAGHAAATRSTSRSCASCSRSPRSCSAALRPRSSCAWTSSDGYVLERRRRWQARLRPLHADPAAARAHPAPGPVPGDWLLASRGTELERVTLAVSGRTRCGTCAEDGRRPRTSAATEGVQRIHATIAQNVGRPVRARTRGRRGPWRPRGRGAVGDRSGPRRRSTSGTSKVVGARRRGHQRGRRSTSSARARVPTIGLRKGLVNNIEQTVASIHQAVEQAERLSGLRLEAAFVGVGGNHVESLNSRGTVAVSGAHREVTREDVERATEVARAVTIPSNREVLHVLPRDFTVDGQEGVKDPVGMSAIRLEVTTHIVHGSATALQNLTKCVRQAGSDRTSSSSPRSPRARPCSPRPSGSWAWRSPTSARAPPTSRCTRRARRSTPRSCRSAASTSPTTSPSACAPTSSPRSS